MISFLLKIILTACCSNYLITENSNNIDVSSSLISEATTLSSKESFAAEIITGGSSEMNLDSGNLFSVDDKKFQTDKLNSPGSLLYDCPDTNQEFNECGSPCQLTCDNFSRKPRVCPRKCISGCFCKDGFVWDQAKGQCIRPDQCDNFCGENAIYKRCSRECQFCDTDNRILILIDCNFKCTSGCFCQPNFVRSMDDGKCVPIDECNA